MTFMNFTNQHFKSRNILYFRNLRHLTSTALWNLRSPFPFIATNCLIWYIYSESGSATDFHYCPSGERLIVILSVLNHLDLKVFVVLIETGTEHWCWKNQLGSPFIIFSNSKLSTSE
jgi:hypothetical protein